MVEERAAAAARNNADLYERVFQAHGLAYRREAYGFIGIDPAPPFYSDVTTTSVGQQAEQRAEIDALRMGNGKGFCFKDSFCQHDLSGSGMDILFEARWLWSPCERFADASDYHWRQIASERDLALWERAWNASGSPTDRRMFPPEMLDMPDIAFFGHGDEAGFETGCIVNISEDCIGLSNVFTSGNIALVTAEAARCAASLASSRPIVAYDSGKTLSAMLEAGFEDVGPLRVWIDRR